MIILYIFAQEMFSRSPKFKSVYAVISTIKYRTARKLPKMHVNYKIQNVVHCNVVHQNSVVFFTGNCTKLREIFNFHASAIPCTSVFQTKLFCGPVKYLNFLLNTITIIIQVYAVYSKLLNKQNNFLCRYSFLTCFFYH